MIYNTVACGKRIREARRKMGLSQFELGERLSISPKYLSRIETGYQTPSLELMVLMSKALDESIDMLIFGATSCRIANQVWIKKKIRHILAQLSDIDSIL